MKQTLEQQAQLDQGRVALLVEHARATVRDLEEQLDSAHGTAPMDGTLYSLPIRQGDFVKEGDLLAEIADLHHVRIRAFIDEPELGQIAVNQPVEILWDAHPGPRMDRQDRSASEASSDAWDAQRRRTAVLGDE